MEKLDEFYTRGFHTYIWDSHFNHFPILSDHNIDLNSWFIKLKQMDHFEEYIKAGGTVSDISISHYFGEAKLLSFIEWLHLEELEEHIWIHIRNDREQLGQHTSYDDLKKSVNIQPVRHNTYAIIDSNSSIVLIDTEVMTLDEMKDKFKVFNWTRR